MFAARNMLFASAAFSPLSLSPALWLDGADASTLYDATTGGSLVAPDGSIARWEDKSGNARHLTQLTAIFRPQRKTSIQNALDIVRFDGSNDLLSVQNSFLNALSGFSVFCVNKWQRNAGNNGTVYSYGVNGVFTNDILSGQFGASTRLYQVNNGADGSASITANPPANAIIESLLYDGSQTGNANRLRVVIDGVAQSPSYTGYTVPATTASPTSPTFALGGYFPSLNFNYFQGDIAEIIVLPYATTADQKAQVERYLAVKWGVTI